MATEIQGNTVVQRPTIGNISKDLLLLLANPETAATAKATLEAVINFVSKNLPPSTAATPSLLIPRGQRTTTAQEGLVNNGGVLEWLNRQFAGTDSITYRNLLGRPNGDDMISSIIAGGNSYGVYSTLDNAAAINTPGNWVRGSNISGGANYWIYICIGAMDAGGARLYNIIASRGLDWDSKLYMCCTAQDSKDWKYIQLI